MPPQKFLLSAFNFYAAVQECFDRIGEDLSAFLRLLATHAASSVLVLAGEPRSVGAQVSVTYAFYPDSCVDEGQRRERLGYIRRALLRGQRMHPISSLLYVSK